MSEKRGATIKLEYPFNSAGCLEVQLPNGNWYRVTCREFRSFTYPRRISQNKGKEYITEIYEGPTYLYGTNTIVNLDKVEKRGLLFPNDVDPRKIKDTRAFGRI
jgi:hypothetical protein